MHLVKPEAQARHCSWTEILHQDICRFNETPQYLFSSWRTNINGDPILVAIHGDECGRFSVIVRRSHAPRIISASRIFDFDNLGSQVRQ